MEKIMVKMMEGRPERKFEEKFEEKASEKFLKRSLGKKIFDFLFMPLEASYTVEASIVFSICLLTIGAVILLGLSIYQESLSAASSRMEDINVTRRFRLIAAGKDILEQLK